LLRTKNIMVCCVLRRNKHPTLCSVVTILNTLIVLNYGYRHRRNKENRDPYINNPFSIHLLSPCYGGAVQGFSGCCGLAIYSNPLNDRPIKLFC